MAGIAAREINPANPAIHRATTAEEIWTAIGGKVDILVAGVGTGGTITGVGEALKERNPQIKIVAVKPRRIRRCSRGGARRGHILLRASAPGKGILCGISSGAAVWACLHLAARRATHGKTIATILPDTGERYLSTDLMTMVA